MPWVLTTRRAAARPLHAASRSSGTPGAGDRRDPEERQAERLGSLAQSAHPAFIVERVDLVGGDELRLGGQLRPEQLQLPAHRVEIVHRIAAACARDVDEVHQDLRAFEMPQELVAETETAVCAFDQARYVGDDEAAILAQPDDAEIRCERGEWIVGDLRTSRGDPRDERRFARVRIPDEPDIGQELQLEAEVFLFARLAGLDLPRRAVRRCREVRVAETSAAASGDEHALSLLGKIGEQSRRLLGSSARSCTSVPMGTGSSRSAPPEPVRFEPCPCSPRSAVNSG